MFEHDVVFPRWDMLVFLKVNKTHSMLEIKFDVHVLAMFEGFPMKDFPCNSGST